MKNKFFKNKGITIAFLGPDGSGKSTIISGLLTKDLPFKRSDYFHLKPFYQKENLTHTVDQDPHKYAPYGNFKSYLKLVVFVFQYNYGWLKNINPLMKKSSFIIFDRYYDDMLVDFKRYRYGGNTTIAKWVGHLIPRPSLYFILTADSSIIHARKQEVPIIELERQIEAYRCLIDDKRYIGVDVSKSPEDIVEQLFKIIIKRSNEH